MTKEELVLTINKQLKEEPAVKFGLHMEVDEIRFEDGWWLVPVGSGVPNVNAFQYSPVLNQIEEEFEAQGTRVLLVPALRD